MPYITLDNASLAYGHHALLDHAAFQLDAGERVGLIGRNGAGKSSLFALLMGQLPEDSGECWIPTAWEIATVARFLASDKAAYVSGQVISINGGMA